MDTSALGILCSNAMEQLADRYAECELRTVAIVIDVGLPHMLVISSEDRPWVQRAFLDEGIEAIDCAENARYEQEDADDG